MVRVQCIFGRSIARDEPVKPVLQQQAGQHRGLVGCKVGHQGATATAMAIKSCELLLPGGDWRGGWGGPPRDWLLASAGR